MTRTLLALPLAAAAALGACNNETIVAGPGANDSANDAVANVALPPSIKATKLYRCPDNKIVQIDWLSDNLSANLRPDEGGAVIRLAAPEPGKPMVAEGGFELDGSAEAPSIKLTLAGGSAQTCTA